MFRSAFLSCLVGCRLQITSFPVSWKEEQESKLLLENLFRCPYMILLGVCGHVAGWYDLQGGTHHNTEVGHDAARGDNKYDLLSIITSHIYHGNSSPVGVAEAEISVGQLVLPVQNEVQQSSSASPAVAANLSI